MREYKIIDEDNYKDYADEILNEDYSIKRLSQLINS